VGLPALWKAQLIPLGWQIPLSSRHPASEIPKMPLSFVAAKPRYMENFDSFSKFSIPLSLFVLSAIQHPASIIAFMFLSVWVCGYCFLVLSAILHLVSTISFLLLPSAVVLFHPAAEIIQNASFFLSGEAALHGEFCALCKILHLVKRKKKILRQRRLEMLVVGDDQLDIANKS